MVSPYRKDVEALEKVQKRFTRMLPVFKGISYKERLVRLALFSSATSEAEGRLGISI